MKKLKTFITIKVTAVSILFCLFSAVAMPKYYYLNKKNEANECRVNQIIVETALAVAYAENIANGINHFPEELNGDMFADGKIPVCPIDGHPIEFNRLTGNAYCPNHIESHAQIVH